MLRKKSGKFLRFFRPDYEYRSITLIKLINILAQLRHMRLAIRSEKATVEDQQDVLFASELRKRNIIAIVVGQVEIGCFSI
jgi:hypothetical protein